MCIKVSFVVITLQIVAWALSKTPARDFAKNYVGVLPFVVGALD